MSIILRDFYIHLGNKDDAPLLISAGGEAGNVNVLNTEQRDDDNGMTCKLLLYS